MSNAEGRGGGLFAPLRRIAHGLLGLLQTRVELFSLELQSEKLRFLDTLLRFAVALSFAFIGLFLGAMTLALFVWEFARYRGLIVMTGLFLVAAVFLLWRIRKEFEKSPPPFSKTIEEFRKDTECFNSKE